MKTCNDCKFKTTVEKARIEYIANGTSSCSYTKENIEYEDICMVDPCEVLLRPNRIACHKYQENADRT